MDAWDFAAAEDELDTASEVFGRRATLESQASGLDLDLTTQLRDAFENDGLGAARSEADEQLAALNAIAEATNVLEADWQIVEQVGLIGELPPATALADARDAFEGGDDTDAAASARTAVEQRQAADPRGRTRVAVVGGVILGVDALAMSLLALRRRQPRRPAAPPGG